MPSINILIVEKTGEIRSLKIKEYAESELFKKAGFKSAEHFKRQTSWAVNVEGVEHKVMLYAKSTGKAGSENKYDFPPPADSTLFFGACVLVGMRGDQPTDLSVDQWNTFYEFLFGGFEDLGSEEEDEEELDTDDEIEALEQHVEKTTGKQITIQTTKQGYIKDDFIVDDSEEIEVNTESESEVEIKPKKSKAVKATKKKSKNTATEEAETKQSTSADQAFLNCTSELTYEEYHK
jgi:hypothetical protein